jgi:hypothetical protein
MTPSVLLDHFTEVASTKDYLVNSNAPKFDYDTKVGGETDVFAKQAEQKPTFGDWRDDFFTKGFSVVKGAIPRERAIQYRERAMDWFSKFDLGLDLNDKETWTEDHLPIMMNGGMVLNHCAPHERWVWEARWYVLNFFCAGSDAKISQ